MSKAPASWEICCRNMLATPEPRAAVHLSPELNHLAVLRAKLEYCFHVQSNHCSCVQAFRYLYVARSKSTQRALLPCHVITAQILGCQSANLYAALLPLPACEHLRQVPFPPYAAHLPWWPSSPLWSFQRLCLLCLKHMHFFPYPKGHSWLWHPPGWYVTPSFHDHIFSKRKLHMGALASLLTLCNLASSPTSCFFS